MDDQISIPAHFASGVQIASNGNEVMLVFTQMNPNVPEGGANRPTVSVSLPRGTANDLHVALGGILQDLKQELGPINTPFLKERREQAQ